MPKRSREADGPVQNKRRSERLSAKNKDGAEHIEQTQECKLFALPAELRNSIYEEVLLQEARIEVTTDSRVPPLLQVSRQIRAETVAMWHKGNKFHFFIEGCDATLVWSWERLFSKLGLGYAEYLMTVEETPNWTNLMKWCKTICERKCGAVPADTKDTRFMSVIAVANGIAFQFSQFGGSWWACEQVLGELRGTAAKHDKAWEI
ncbi:hypothetical protein LTR15_007840 [Elasticomyces elasticus]|nr:hypothetical protein LTR15_007840 [Elasticomyces elasticus]